MMIKKIKEFIKHFNMTRDILFYLLESQFTMYLILKDICIQQRAGSRAVRYMDWIEENLKTIDMIKNQLQGERR